MFEWLISPEAWIALGTLTALEIVLGIDNIIFISVLVGRLPEQQRNHCQETRPGPGHDLATRSAVFHHLDHGIDQPLVYVVRAGIVRP